MGKQIGLTLVTVVLALFIAGCGTKIVTGDTSMGGSSAPTRPYGMKSVLPGDGAGGGGESAGEINGTCEMILPTQAEPRTCEDVTLFIRSPADGEERRAEVSGAKFKFTSLNKASYRLNAASSKYDLETNVKNEVTPGQTLKIRILAKPRS